MTMETAVEGRQDATGSGYTLYSTPACHLCELAVAMIGAVVGQAAVASLREVDISESDALFERYGVRIPVLQHPDGRELDWPFEENALRQFMAA